MISLDNVSKIYGSGINKTEALKGITIKVNKGEMVAIIGKSGSGKTTLLNILGGMDTATSGKYVFGNTVVSNLKKDKLDMFRRENVSFVFQNFALMNEYTVYENIELPLIAKKINKKERKKVIKEVLELMKISELSNKLPSKISGGQQQRCAIARAIASGNDLILADEPTGALDKVTGNMIIDYLAEINKEGKTLIIVTHDESIAARCDRIIRIEDGKLL